MFSWVLFVCYRCIPQNCTFGEKFNAFFGRCEKIQCQPGFNVTLFGKCIGMCWRNIKEKKKDVLFSELDINECAQKPSPCKIGERCDNVPGSYKCVQTFACANGLQMKDLQCLGKFLKFFLKKSTSILNRYWWMYDW